jgi:pSer/pThr/pTyr-binding forkhead associated (FHA) protein
MPYCSQCGSQNSDNARFCSQCGSPLTPPPEAGLEPTPDDATATITFGAPAKSDSDERTSLNAADAAAVDALPAGSALLVVQRGPGAGSRYLLDTDLSTVGRHPESDIFLDDITVSRRHVEFRREAENFRLHDVGSLNGTYLNGDRVDDAELQNGDEVRIGKFRLIFFASDAKGS